MKIERTFVVLYRWRLKPGLENEFAEAWSVITREFLADFDSLGSRLHRGSDGIWYAYAQWRSRADREKAFLSGAAATAAAQMKNATTERFPEVLLEIVSDHLKPAGSAEG